VPTVTLPQAGARVYYARHRQRPPAPPLILIHGAGGSHLAWPAELRRLPGFTVYAIDLPGHGRSPRTAHRTIPAYAQIVTEFLEVLAIENAVLLGFSMGGAVALQAALCGAPGLRGLVLISTAASLPIPKSVINLLRQDYPAALEHLSQALFCDHSFAELGLRFLQRTDPQVVRQDFVACRQFSPPARLSELKLPALVLGSRSDLMVPPDSITSLAAQIENSQAHWIQNAGHMVILEQPQVVADAVRSFLLSIH
jgi:pimeloyl-ACP methyl ester carboxylesterase